MNNNLFSLIHLQKLSLIIYISYNNLIFSSSPKEKPYKKQAHILINGPKIIVHSL